MGFTAAGKKLKLGYDYVCSVVDGHSRCVYTEILDDEIAAATAGFLARALAVFADAGFRVERLMSDNHWSYTRSLALAELLDQQGNKHVFIRPHCPRRDRKVERFNRTLQTEWAYRQPFQSNQKYADTLAPGPTTTTMNATTPPSETNPHQPTVTNLIAEYT